MDFESLSKYIQYIIEQHTSVSIENIETFEVLINDDYEFVKNNLEDLNYHFKNSRELITFIKLVQFLKNSSDNVEKIVEFTDDFFLGYIIPQINKEFDLIRFGTNYNINIELKSDTTLEEQIEQLRKNYFYLHFLEFPTKYYSYSPDISSFIEYIPEIDNYLEVDVLSFLETIFQQDIKRYTLEEVNNFFDIKNYLVNPFNDIDKFLDDKYFLTNHQIDIVKDIIERKLDIKLFGIKGNPGTGKSLLIYHIAKNLITLNKRFVIIHGANLNDGQIALNEIGYNIKPIKEISEVLKNANNYDYIIIDEAQRLRECGKYYQLTELSLSMLQSKSKFIVSMDGNQILSPDEDPNNATKLYDFIRKNGQVYSLKNKFRTNKNLSNFIKLLFKITERDNKIENKDKKITVKYFESREKADVYLNSKVNDKEWVVLNYTKSPTPYYGSRSFQELDRMGDYGLNSHKVIGQEFNNVIIPLDTNFFYESECLNTSESNELKNSVKILKTTYSYYPLDKMLYQNLSRTRERIEVVIIKNKQLFVEICNILNNV